MNPTRKLTDILQNIAVFALPETVLFPGVVLPLHIFERSYRRMVADALAAHSCLVVAMAQPQTVTSAGLDPCEVGCVGRIIHSELLADGKYNILVQGIERVRLLEEHAGLMPYRCFRAEPLPRPTAEALEAAHDSWVRLRSCVCSLGAAAAHADQELVEVLRSTADPLELTDILTAVLVREPAVQQRMLATTCLTTRIDGLVESMVDAMARYQSQPVDNRPELN